MSELIITENSNITAIADAVRNKTGVISNLTIGSIVDCINSFPELDNVILDEEINEQDSLISQLQIALEDKAAGIDTSDATINSGSQMLGGVTAYGANGKIIGTIPSQTEKTVIPSKSSQIAITSGTYVSGNITVSAIPSEYVSTSDATATADDIMNGKTAYVNGTKLTGTHECSSGSGGSESIETVTGTIDFYDPYNPYVFCYEDGNGTINKFTASLGASSGTFIIRKNSIIVFHCPKLADGSASMKVGVELSVLQSTSGVDIIHSTTINDMIVDAICKVTGNFNISWEIDDF